MFFLFFSYESMIIHLQETWNIQNRVSYSSTIYYNFFKVDELRFLVGVYNSCFCVALGLSRHPYGGSQNSPKALLSE